MTEPLMSRPPHLIEARPSEEYRSEGRKPGGEGRRLGHVEGLNQDLRPDKQAGYKNRDGFKKNSYHSLSSFFEFPGDGIEQIRVARGDDRLG
ncbi:MAG: hypothetical protein IOC49_10190 [Methylobacterium sp.]|nr:hypothetical protein [Methylobacterium sp.]